MVTPLDFGILKQFEAIFPFIFVLVILYAIFSQWFPLLKGNKTMSALLAFSFAVLTMFSPIAVRSLSLAAPWFVLFIMFLALVLVGVHVLGVSEKNVIDVVTSERYSFIPILVVVVLVVIGLGGVSKAISEEGGFGPGEQTSQEADFYNTIFHPKVLGLIFIMLIAFFTIQTLGRKWDYG